MTTPLPFMNIKAKANQHGFFLILLAVVFFIITLIISQYYLSSYRLVLICVYILAIIIMFTVLLKRSEPRFSFELTPKRIQYYHRHGNWWLNWQQIQNIQTIKEVVGLKTVPLPYVGIMLKNIDDLAQQISLRLANRLTS